MYVTIDVTDYTQLRNLTFAPQIDMTTNALPVNEFSVDIVTTDSIAVGQYAWLYDDLDNLWAKYWITYAERENERTVRVRARSQLVWMDGVKFGETMYDAVALETVLDGIMVRSAGEGIEAPIDYDLDSSLQSITITGYCPEQSARERLQWVLFSIGAYCKTFFNTKPQILPLDATPTLIPLSDTFYKPTVNHSDYVTAVSVTAYTFSRSAQTEAEILADDYSYPFPEGWIADEQAFSVDNSAAPSGVADNPVEIDGIYLINNNNASALLTRLAAKYFKRTTVDVDVIDNAAYIPGDRVVVYGARDALYAGYIESASFKFGKQARATLKLAAAEDVTGAALEVAYTWEGMTLAQETHYLPVGYAYSLATRYLDITMNGHRYIFRPTTDAITGTMPSEGASATVTCAVALDYCEGILEIVSVDDLDMSGGVVSIA